MGALLDRIKLSLLTNGNGIADNYKNNTMFFSKAYQNSSNDIKSITLREIQKGRFYFFTYNEEGGNKWMQYSPVFVVDYKLYDGEILISAINLNFIPIEIRPIIFDTYYDDVSLDNDRYVDIDFKKAYNQLIKFGFEYAIMEYRAKKLIRVHQINNNILPRFLYSGYAINKYDPKKLYGIWKAKIGTRHKRHNEMLKLNVLELMNITDEINENFDVLKKHIQRVRKNFD